MYEIAQHEDLVPIGLCFFFWINVESQDASRLEKEERREIRQKVKPTNNQEAWGGSKSIIG